MKAEQVWAVAAGLVVGAAVLGGLFVLGSPAEQRSRLLDTRRVEDLTHLMWIIRSYYEREGELPASLDQALPEPPRGVAAVMLRDPRSGEPYGFRVLDENHFELCARFESAAGPSAAVLPRGVDPFLFHGAGQQCFSLEAALPQPTALRAGR